MSLKGYQWLNDNGKVIMSFTFKDLTLDVWENITKKELNDFIEYLKEHSWECAKIEYHDKEIR